MSYPYEFVVGKAKMTFRIVSKHDNTRLDIVHIDIAGTSWDDVMRCKNIYDAIDAIVGTSTVVEAIAKCEKAVSVDTRDVIMQFMRAALQYRSSTMIRSLMTKYNACAGERLLLNQYMTEFGSSAHTKSTIYGVPIVDTFTCGNASVKYKITFNTPIECTYVYSGSNTDDVLACTKFANMLTHVCKAGKISEAQLGEFESTLKPVYALACTWLDVPMGYESTSTHKPVPTSVDATELSKTFNVSCGSVLNQITVTKNGAILRVVGEYDAMVFNIFQVLGSDPLPFIKQDMRTWYEIANYIGNTKAAKRMFWRSFNIKYDTCTYTIAFSREGQWYHDSNETVPEPLQRWLKKIAAGRMCGSLCTCEEKHRYDTESIRAFTWLHGVHPVEVGIQYQCADFDALVADRNKW